MTGGQPVRADQRGPVIAQTCRAEGVAGGFALVSDVIDKFRRADSRRHQPSIRAKTNG